MASLICFMVTGIIAGASRGWSGSWRVVLLVPEFGWLRWVRSIFFFESTRLVWFVSERWGRGGVFKRPYLLRGERKRSTWRVQRYILLAE